MSHSLRLRLLWLGAAVLIAIALAVRATVVGQGNFYWDDIVFGSRSADPLTDLGSWFVDYDGHLMPGALYVAAVIGRLAPLQWPVAAASLVVLQAVASVLTLRTLVIVVGRRPVVLAPLAFYLFSPLTLPAMAWWAAGLNALPLQIGLAVVVAETVRYLRGNRRSGLWAVLALVGTLLFFEKALIIPVVAVGTAVLMRALRGHGHPIRAVLRRGARLWLAFGVVVVCWFVLWLALTAARPGGQTIGFAGSALYRSATSVLAPAVFAAPWEWTRRNPGPPLVVPNLALTVLGVLLIAVIGYLTWRRCPRGLLVWAAAAAYCSASLAPVFFLRSSEFTSNLLPLSLRYFADSAWVFALAGALVLTAPARPAADRPAGGGSARVPRQAIAAGIVVALFVGSSVVSTLRFSTVWADNPTGEYLAQVRAGAQEYAGRPMLDQQINNSILARLAYPDNTLSRVLGSVRERPQLSSSSAEPTVVDARGRFVPGQVTRVRSVPVGPIPGCGTRIDGTPALLGYEGPLAYWEWIVQLNYLASADGELMVQQEFAPQAVTVPVRRGPNTVYVQVPGAGGGLSVRALTPDLIACVAGGPVGLLIPASASGAPGNVSPGG